MTAINFPMNLTRRRGRPMIIGMTPLGRTIQERRNALGLTLAAVKELSKVNIQTISMIETGEAKDPRFSTIIAIAAALEMNLYDLAATYGEAPPSDKFPSAVS